MSEVEFTESRWRELRLSIIVPEDERVDRAQPYSLARRYQVRRVSVRLGAMDGKEGSLDIKFDGPLVTKAGPSSKVRCDEVFWNPDEGLATCPESVRSLIVARVAAWRAEVEA